MRSVKRAGDLLKKAHGRKVKRPRKEKACATAVGHALTRVQAVEQRRVIVARLDCKLRGMLPDGGCGVCRAALLSVSPKFLRRHRAAGVAIRPAPAPSAPGAAAGVGTTVKTKTKMAMETLTCAARWCKRWAQAAAPRHWPVSKRVWR